MPNNMDVTCANYFLVGRRVMRRSPSKAKKKQLASATSVFGGSDCKGT